MRTLHTLLVALLLGGCNRETPPSSTFEPPPASAREPPARALHPVTIAVPSNHGALDVGYYEVRGTPAAVGCATCHLAGTTEPIAQRARADGSRERFHTDITLAHGTLVCESCHVTSQPTQLHLATGDLVPMAESMSLCAQCHGSQKRDYDHGAHGGMRGYWDLTRGPRQRNHCVACHPVHAPQYPLVIPAPPPRDRFTQSKSLVGSAVEARFGAAQGDSHE